MRGRAALGKKFRNSVVGGRRCSGGQIEDDRVAKDVQLPDKVAGMPECTFMLALASRKWPIHILIFPVFSLLQKLRSMMR